jgi:hypothetical protein
MTGQPGKSGGARHGAGAPPALKFKNRQRVRVSVLLGGAWQDAEVSITRGKPHEMILVAGKFTITIRHAPIVMRAKKSQ